MNRDPYMDMLEKISNPTYHALTGKLKNQVVTPIRCLRCLISYLKA